MAQARDRRRGGAGFTLIEVMLAVTIFGIVATALYGTFARTLRSKTLGEERIDVVRTGRTAVGRMADEIMTAVYPSEALDEYRFQALAGGSEAAPLDSLSFSTFSNGGGSEARNTDQRVIEYFFPADLTGKRRDRRNDRTSEVPPPVPDAAPATAPDDLGAARRRREDGVVDFFATFGSDSLRARGIAAERLLRREAPLLQRDALADAYATVFLDNVASLKLRFCDGREWTDEWDSNDARLSPGLPRAVAIDLGLYDDDGAVHHFATAVDLTMTRIRGKGTCPPWGPATERGRRP
jgi:prepilin-type N-terminal cleavage/methylation domain-containing protein